MGNDIYLINLIQSVLQYDTHFNLEISHGVPEKESLP